MYSNRRRQIHLERGETTPFSFLLSLLLFRSENLLHVVEKKARTGLARVRRFT